MNRLLIIIVTVWFAVGSFFSYAQNGKGDIAYVEKVEVNINTDFLITGEILLYSIHCLETDKNRYSTLSKLVYVELVGENEKSFLQNKVPLVEGRGAGDFFLPSTLPSGNYTLIAYTKWMRNFPLEHFFQKQITIINPYLKSPIAETQGDDNSNSLTRLSNQMSQNKTRQIQLTFDKKSYSKRQKVVVVIKNNDAVYDCKISLNVHHFKSTASTSRPDSLSRGNVNSVLQKETQIKNNFISFLPDLRGETIGGVAISKEGNSSKPIANTDIYLSAPGSTYVFQVSRTDSTGRFYFSTKDIQTNTGIQFQVDGLLESTPFEIILDDEFVNSYKKFRPLPLSIDTSLRRQIEQRNVYSQIENAYFINKRDSVVNLNQKPFFGTPDKVYKLDDFTRFPTMEDIFREYIYEVVVSRREGKFKLQMLNSGNRDSRFSDTPLMLVDGIRVFNTETIMNYNPLLIKSISLITRQYVYGGILFDGILSVNTYSGNAKELPISSSQKEYLPWQRPKKYYSPVYNSNAHLDRIPDYRVQLYWNPVLSIEPNHEFVAEFYTSDIDGDFLIEVKGFNSNGEVVDIRNIIEVKK